MIIHTSFWHPFYLFFSVCGTYKITTKDSLDLKLKPRLQPSLMLCDDCLDKLKLDISNQDENWSSQDTFLSSQSTNGGEFADLSSTVNTTLGRIQRVCSLLEISPVKTSNFNSLNSDQRLKVIKR